MLAVACGGDGATSEKATPLPDSALELTRVAGLIAPTPAFLIDETTAWWTIRGLSLRGLPDSLDMNSTPLGADEVESLWRGRLANTEIWGNFDRRVRLELCANGVGRSLDEFSPAFGHSLRWTVERDDEKIPGMSAPNDYPEWNAILLRIDSEGGTDFSTTSQLEELLAANLDPEFRSVYRFGQRFGDYDYPDGPNWYDLGPVTFAHHEWVIMDHPNCGQ